MTTGRLSMYTQHQHGHGHGQGSRSGRIAFRQQRLWLARLAVKGKTILLTLPCFLYIGIVLLISDTTRVINQSYVSRLNSENFEKYNLPRIRLDPRLFPRTSSLPTDDDACPFKVIQGKWDVVNSTELGRIGMSQVIFKMHGVEDEDGELTYYYPVVPEEFCKSSYLREWNLMHRKLEEIQHICDNHQGPHGVLGKEFQWKQPSPPTLPLFRPPPVWNRATLMYGSRVMIQKDGVIYTKWGQVRGSDCCYCEKAPLLPSRGLCECLEQNICPSSSSHSDEHRTNNGRTQEANGLDTESVISSSRSMVKSMPCVKMNFTVMQGKSVNQTAKKEKENPCELPYQKGRVFVISQTYGTEFAHFLQEEWPRIFPFLDELLRDKSVKIHIKAVHSEFVPKFVEDAFELVGIDKSRLIYGDMIAEHAFVPWNIACGCPVDQFWKIRQLRRRVLKKLGLHEDGKKSKNKRKKSNRGSRRSSVSNGLEETVREKKRIVVIERSKGLRSIPERAFEEFLNGLNALLSDEYSIEVFSDADKDLMECLTCQITLFATAHAVIGVHGAGLSQIIFSPPGTLVVELGCLSVVSSQYLKLATMLGHKFYYALPRKSTLVVPNIPVVLQNIVRLLEARVEPSTTISSPSSSSSTTDSSSESSSSS